MMRRLSLLMLLILITFSTAAFAESDSNTITPAQEKIPRVAVVIVDRTTQWDQEFWIDGLSDFLMDRYSYLMSPADLEVITSSDKVDYSKEALAQIAENKHADQVVLVVIDRADQTWLPSWRIGGHTSFDSDDSFVTTIFMQSALYQPSTGKYSKKKVWENTTDDNNLERLLREKTETLIKKMEKEVPPLL